MYSTHRINQSVRSFFFSGALKTVKTAFFKFLKKNAKNTTTKTEVRNQ